MINEWGEAAGLSESLADVFNYLMFSITLVFKTKLKIKMTPGMDARGYQLVCWIKCSEEGSFDEALAWSPG